MIRYFWTILLFAACASTSPTVIHDKVITYVHDTTKIVRHDTVTFAAGTIIIHDTVSQFAIRDTSNTANTIIIEPLVGDNYPQLQNAADYQLATPGVRIYVQPGYYQISRPLIFARIIAGKYVQVTPQFEGAVNAKNTPDGQVTRIAPMFNDRPAVLFQLAKGGYFKNVSIAGNYFLPDHRNVIQVDTMLASEWNDGTARFNQSSPYCGIAIDPFSDSAIMPAGGLYPGLESYYLPGMSRSGSTAVTFEGIAIKNFVVGFIITPSNQQNGEIIHLHQSQVQSCFTGYAICQAQSKQCEVKDLECWGSVFSLIDNNTWGVRHGDGAGSPMIDGINIAGHIHQIFNVTNYTFSGIYNNIYGEGVYKIGLLGGNAGAKVDGMNVDFENGNSPNLPTPDFYYYANNVIFSNCILRFYPGAVPGMRMIHNGVNVKFEFGEQNEQPLARLDGGAAVNYPTMEGVTKYSIKGIINDSHRDTCYFLTVNTIHVNPDFTGYFVRYGYPNDRGDINKISVGDPVITTHKGRNIPGQLFWNYPLGYISKVSNDTVYLNNIGVGIHDGEYYAEIVYSLKP